MEDYGLTTESRQIAVENSSCSCCCCCCEKYFGKCIITKSWKEIWKNDSRLLRVIAVLTIVLNIPYGDYALYPFKLFSTWIHESCHALAALSVGGKVEWLNVYQDGSGLAYTGVPANCWFCRGWVANAGYSGTAVVGGILLMFRRRGTRLGTAIIGVLLLLSCAIWVRNLFGLFAFLLMGILLLLCAWKASDFFVSELFATLAATTCLNAVTSIKVLYSPGSAVVNGVQSPTDATSMQNSTLIPYYIWATIWLLLAIVCTMIGVTIVVQPPPDDTSTPATSSSQDFAEDERMPMETELT